MFNVEPKTKILKTTLLRKITRCSTKCGSDDVVPYWVADMDFPIAPSITQELQRLVTRETFSYEFDSSRFCLYI